MSEMNPGLDANAERSRWWVFDTPIWRDWIFWLAAVATFAGVQGTLAGYSGSTRGGPFLIDLALAVAVQLVLFAVIPSSLRSVWRRRRARRGQRL
jgi:uncharacterized membrane protein YfcA